MKGISGDFDINSLDYFWKAVVCDFLILLFKIALSAIDRLIRVAKTIPTIIDHVLTNSMIDLPLHSGFLKNWYKLLLYCVLLSKN